MTRVALLYAAVGGAALVAAVGIPWQVHRAGGAALPGWQGLVNPGRISEAHGFIAGQCEACHVPHRGVADAKCAACHADTPFQDKASTAFHAQAKICTTCHVEHQGPAAPTRMEHAALLDADTWRGGRAAVPPPARAAPAGAIPAGAIPAGPGLDCAACHGAKDPHQGLFGRQCASCHATDGWRIASFRHPAMRSTDCAECHLPPPSHRMMHFSMVSQAFARKKAKVEQCYACHATDAWNNIRGRGYYDHH